MQVVKKYRGPLCQVPGPLCQRPVGRSSGSPPGPAVCHLHPSGAGLPGSRAGRLWTSMAISRRSMRPPPEVHRLLPLRPRYLGRPLHPAVTEGLHVCRLSHPHGPGWGVLQRRHCRPPGRPREDPDPPPAGNLPVPGVYIPPRWGRPVGRGPAGPGAGRCIRHHLPDSPLPHLQAGPLRRLHWPGV